MTRRDAKRPYAEVIGCPIGHSKSPTIHGFWLERLGLAGSYRTAHVMPAELGTYFAARRFDPAWRGCNVTIPHKQGVALIVDTLDARAAAVGAVNTVLRADDGALTGTNTDVDGIAEAIAGVPAGPVVLLGAGGAARAAMATLAEQGAADVRVLARDVDRARSAAHECGLAAARIVPFAAAGAGALDDTVLLINATQLGMSGQQAMPDIVLDGLGALAPGATVFDMVYAPLRTPLLAAAAQRGLTAVDGLTMLIGQAATAFARLFGRPAPRADDALLRERLGA